MPLRAILPNGTSQVVSCSTAFTREQIDDPYLSRKTPAFVLEPTSESQPNAVLLRSGCSSAVIVEQQDGDSSIWKPLGILHQGQTMQLGADSRFYITSRQATTSVILISSAASLEQGPSAVANEATDAVVPPAAATAPDAQDQNRSTTPVATTAAAAVAAAAAALAATTDPAGLPPLAGSNGIDEEEPPSEAGLTGSRLGTSTGQAERAEEADGDAEPCRVVRSPSGWSVPTSAPVPPAVAAGASAAGTSREQAAASVPQSPAPVHCCGSPAALACTRAAEGREGEGSGGGPAKRPRLTPPSLARSGGRGAAPANAAAADVATASAAATANAGAVASTSNGGAGGSVGSSAPVGAPFYLLAVRGLPATYNSGSMGARLHDLIPAAGLEYALVSNYMIDLVWLLSACPALAAAPRVLLVHGEKGERVTYMRQAISEKGLGGSFQLHAPPLPERFGTHHSKAFVLVYRGGLRLVVHTANLLLQDCNNKTQGLWWQDFPRKAAGGNDAPAAAAAPPSEMEAVLSDYMTALRLPDPDRLRMQETIKAHDFSAARAHLLVSLPGTHRASPPRQDKLHAYGHMAVRRHLAQYTFPAAFRHAALLCQCSSMGSFNEQWLVGELGDSLCAGQYEGQPAAPAQAEARPTIGYKKAGGKHHVEVVWPTIDEVCNSIEGWAAGNSIPGPAKNVTQPWLQPRFRRFGGEPVGRQRAMPHIKTYVRYAGHRLPYFILTSSNLSKAAWGGLQLNGQQLHIRSYEMGVLLTPELERRYRASPQAGFRCAPVSGSWATVDGSQCTACPADGGIGSSNGGGSVFGSLTAGACDADLPVEFHALDSRASSSQIPPAGPSGSTGGTGGTGTEDDAGAAVRTDGSTAVRRVYLPLPYKLPPERYRPDDRGPWTVDGHHEGYDLLGCTLDSPAPRYYGNLQDQAWLSEGGG